MPRASQPQSGLRGPGQDVWSDQNKQTVVSMVFEPEYIQVLRKGGEDEGGSVSNEYEPHGSPLDGRIDQIGVGQGAATVFGDQVSEGATHVVSTVIDADVKTEDRLEIEGKVFIIKSAIVRTKQATTQLQVKEYHG